MLFNFRGACTDVYRGHSLVHSVLCAACTDDQVTYAEHLWNVILFHDQALIIKMQGKHGQSGLQNSSIIPPGSIEN